MAGLVFLLGFWVLAGACQRHGVSGFLLRSYSSSSHHHNRPLQGDGRPGSPEGPPVVNSPKPRTSIFLPGFLWYLTQTKQHVARFRWFEKDSKWHFFFGRSTLPREWHANTDQNRCFQAVCCLTPKARKKIFYESSGSESALLGIPPAPKYLCEPYFKIIARTDHGNPALPGRQSTRLGSRSGAAVVPKTSFFS